MNRFDFEGRIALVTGGAQGIGAAVATRLMQSGARVAIWDIAADKNTDSDWLLNLQVDVTDPESVNNGMEAVLKRWEAVDILVASAGIAGPTATLWEYSLEDWQRVQRVNVDGTFLSCRAVLPAMISRNYGRIVNISSIAGKEGNPNASAYSASKASVIALTKSLGKEVALYDIAANCITPAAADTNILQSVSDEFVEYMLSKIPRARLLKLDEISSMVAWLVSSENSFTTGAVFDLSGGRATY